MIRFKVEMTYRDDTTETFDCSEHPTIGDSYITIYHNNDNRTYKPKEAIKHFKVKDYWKK